MTRAEMLEQVQKLEEAIGDGKGKSLFSSTKVFMMAGEWQGLKKALGDESETAWAMLWRLRKI